MNTRDDLSALLDDELDDAELAALEQELAGDDGLRADLEELRGVAEGLRGLGDVKAPDGFLAAVMGRIEAGEGSDGGPLLVPDTEPLPDNVVRMSWFIKGPALAAIAALLLVGVGIGLRDQGPEAPPAATDLVVRAPGTTAPQPTGAMGSNFDFDGLASADAEEADDAAAATAERIRMTPSDENRVAVGGAGTGPAVPAAPRRSGIREVPAASPPPGVVAVAEHYAPEPEMADGDAAASIDEMEPDMDEAVEPGLIPSRAEAGALGMSPSGARAKTERARADSPSSAMSAVASLRTSDRSAVSALRDAVEAKGWTLKYVSPSEAAVALSDVQPEQVVELSLPPGQEIAAQRMLDRLGSFKFASTPEQSSGAHSTLRITVLYTP